MTRRTIGEQVLEKLQIYKVKSEGDGKYRCNSPFRAGSNGQSFTLRIDADGEHGAYDDKAGNDSGSLYDLAGKLGIDVPKSDRADVANTKRAYTGLAEYAAAHGAPVEVFSSSGWSDVAEHHGRPALKFKTPSGPRWRYIDGGKPPYWHDKGYKSCWYGLRRAIELANEFSSPLVLVNGEASTLVAQHYSIAAACFTGSGERAIPDVLLDELLNLFPQGQILVALDCDEKGRKATAKVLGQFIERKRADVRGVDLMLGNTGDIADFCMLHTDQAALAIWDLPDTPAPPTKDEESIAALAKAVDNLASATRQDARLKKQEDLNLLIAQAQALIDRVGLAYAQPQIITVTDLAEENKRRLREAMQKPDPVQGLRSNMQRLDKAIGGFQPEVYVIYGATGMGKSWLGVSFIREFHKQGNGLVVPTESNPSRWLTRLAAAITDVDADRQETGEVSETEAQKVEAAYDVLKRTGIAILKGGQPTPTEVRAAVLEGLYKRDYKWVLIDSASKMTAPGTKDIYEKTTLVSDGIQNLMAETGIPIIATTQVGRDVARRKKKMPTLEDAYGGGVIEHNAGVVLGLYRHQYYVDKGLEKPDPEFPANTALVRILKSRWRGGSQTTGVQLVFGGSRGFFELAPEVIHAPSA